MCVCARERACACVCVDVYIFYELVYNYVHYIGGITDWLFKKRSALDEHLSFFPSSVEESGNNQFHKTFYFSNPEDTRGCFNNNKSAS